MTLENVGADNWRACTALEVEQSQQRFVAPVAHYLALCTYGKSPWRPLAVRVGEEVVGFVMWGIDPEDESFWIGGLIIDQRHQRRGYGRAVVAHLLERAASDWHRETALSYDPQNAPDVDTEPTPDPGPFPSDDGSGGLVGQASLNLTTFRS